MGRWTVGELARAAGVSVRTLHHYDEIALLSPARRPGSRYREYADEDVVRLHQIVSLRDLGFSLAEIRAYLAGHGESPVAALELHLRRLGERLQATRILYERLERVVARLRAAEAVMPEEFLQTLRMTIMFEKYYTPEQLKAIEERGRQIGGDRIREVENEWPRLIEEVRVEMEKGTDPSDPRVKELARSWQALVAEFTGGDPGVAASLRRMYETEPEVAGMQTGPMREMGAYIERALSL